MPVSPGFLRRIERYVPVALMLLIVLFVCCIQLRVLQVPQLQQPKPLSGTNRDRIEDKSVLRSERPGGSPCIPARI